MKSFAIMALLTALAACSGPGNKVEDVPVNQMAPDEVTEVQDESAVTLPEETNAANAN